jgi:hypothetical protein
MPVVTVDKAALYKELGREYTTEEFDELCFEFGIELDEDTSQSKKPEDVAQPPQLKIEIPANRYDMLCFEGIAMNLKVFLEKQKLPKWELSPPTSGELQTLTIKPEVGEHGAGVLCCLLTRHRQSRFGGTVPAWSYATLNSTKIDTIPSLRCKINSTRISHDRGHWSQSGRTTLIVSLLSPI